MEANWMKTLKQADDYFGTVYRLSQTKRFKNETLYNIVCLSTEKFLHGYMLSQGAVPFNHTLSTMVRDVRPQLKGSMQTLYSDLQFLDEFQKNIEWQRPKPTDTDMKRMLETLVALREWILSQTTVMVQ